MDQSYFFKNAKWVSGKDRNENSFFVIRGHFNAQKFDFAKLNVLGLGFFKCYINGVCINPDTFLPLSTSYNENCDPVNEVLSGHRIYVPSFDITSYVNEGENIIAIYFGGGWFSFRHSRYGMPKAIFSIEISDGDNVCEFVSDENCKVGSGFIEKYDFAKHEFHNDSDRAYLLGTGFDDSDWENASVVEDLVTEYEVTSCPADKLIGSWVPTANTNELGETIYDAGKNLTGYPVLKVNAPKGERISVLFSEMIKENGELDMKHNHAQEFCVVSNGTDMLIQPEFTWFGFRYFKIEGNAIPVSVKEVHSDVAISSTFECDNETINWIYNTFIHSMLCNMHTGIPSDCPHLERRGYTGDGQITCHSALTVLDAKDFYDKWLKDIADCQDTVSGHVQYTAPYIRSGGGPGGWGSAIVEVPYQMYKHFGDESYLSKYYHNMRRYIDYLDSKSEFGLVVSDKEGQWCLGDWCGPNVLFDDKGLKFHNQQVILPAAMVNTYYKIRSLQRLCEIARIIGKEEDIPEYEEKIAAVKKVYNAAYFNTFDNNYIMNVQGANAFALDIGLGNAKTLENMIYYYKTVGSYDTGIIGTDVLTRVLFENGLGDIAFTLLTSDSVNGFEHWRRKGMTTFCEYWDYNFCRSYNHQMFGSPVAYFFEYFLGIKQEENTAGYRSLVICPQAVSRFGRMTGCMKTPCGSVSVGYVNDGEKVSFKVCIPEGVKAVFRFGDSEKALACGENEIVCNV